MAPVATWMVVPLAIMPPAWFKTAIGSTSTPAPSPRSRAPTGSTKPMRSRSASASRFARRPSFGVDADQQPLGVEPEPDAIPASPLATSVMVPRSLPQT